MKALLGIAIVFACVLGGYVLHHGNLRLLVIPTEYLIIVGMLTGSLITSNPSRVLKGIVKGLFRQLKPEAAERKQYERIFQLIHELLLLKRTKGILALEEHAESPENSSIISRYPEILRDRHAVDLLSDTLRLLVDGAHDSFSLQQMTNSSIAAIHEQEIEPSRALQKAADALPAIGIVAAVLGIILTMNVINEGAATVGRNIAGALVGTFIGVFLAYGVVGPLASALESTTKARDRRLQCIARIFVADAEGHSPGKAIELGRRSIFPEDRPSYEEVSTALLATKEKGDGSDGPSEPH